MIHLLDTQISAHDTTTTKRTCCGLSNPALAKRKGKTTDQVMDANCVACLKTHIQRRDHIIQRLQEELDSLRSSYT